MATKKSWWITRPKRKLILIPDLLKIFSAVAEGHKWYANRSLHINFEKSLKKYEWKAQNVSKDGSGGRTYASMLYMFGLWFEDENGVQITNAGKELIADNPPVPILKKQLLDFQYPSPYSLIPQVNIDKTFRIHPYRFILTLFIEKQIEELSQEEIAFCLVPYAQTSNDLNKCFDFIQEYRQNPIAFAERAVKDSGTTEYNLQQIGNTIVNQLEYTGYFEERADISSLRLKEGMKEKVIEEIKSLRKDFLQNPEDATAFQIRYGAGLEKTKDYRYTNSTPPKINPNDQAILLAYYQITLNEPGSGITEELIRKIAQLKGTSESHVKKVLEPIAQKPQFDRFEEKFLKLSIGGKITARDFEIKTTSIFSNDGFGFAAVWVGPKPRHPDTFVYFDKINKEHGILDAKAYKDYSLPLDHKNKMVHTYIRSFRTLKFEGETYTLKFFNYVAGGFGSGMAKSFKELLTMTDVKGSYITASNLLQLLRKHRARPFSPEKFSEIFSCNEEIIYDQINY